MKQERFQELDALRGFAALGVVAYHYTEHAATHGAEMFRMPWGAHGVQLFFSISGFVIYWTLARSTTLLDFAVSRFSRLYPAYWAALGILCAVQFLFQGLSPWLGGYAVNATMWQHLLGWKDLDVVYWTLAVELMFYVWMAVAFATRMLDRIEWIAAGWLAIAAPLCFVQKAHPLPEVVRTLLIFEQIPFFLAGMMFYRAKQEGWTMIRAALIVLAGATTTILAGWHGAWVSLVVFSIFALATRAWLGWVVNPVTMWMGTISYSLYLTHRAWGDYLMMKMIDAGVSKWAALPLAIAAAVLLASLVTILIERPAMKLIRDLYKRISARKAPAVSAPSLVTDSVGRSPTRIVEPTL